MCDQGKEIVRLSIKEAQVEGGTIEHLTPGMKICYRVPEGIEGSFDLYLQVSPAPVSGCSQPFVFQIGEGEPFSVPVECPVYPDPFEGEVYQNPLEATVYQEEFLGEKEEDKAFRMNLYPIASCVPLLPGEEIKVLASFGAGEEALFPTLGDMECYPVGDALKAKGNAAGALVEEPKEKLEEGRLDEQVGKSKEEQVEGQNETQKEERDILAGRMILWLGSSVTYGAASMGHYSMVDAIRDRHAGTVCEKYAINGTTLVHDAPSSYVNRLLLIPKTKRPDLLVVQLSTNDAAQGKKLGEISSSFQKEDFDLHTVTGAMEYIIAYGRETFGCPVAFYTGTYTKLPGYEEMVELLLALQRKWGIGVFDLFHEPAMRSLYGTELYHGYMNDEVHPTREGYVSWWTPVLEKKMSTFLKEQEGLR